MVFEKWLDMLPVDRPVAVLMRHAEREPIVKAEDAVRALLTASGTEDARSLGAKLVGFSPLELYHSPIERCRQTAEALAEGAQAAGAEVRRGGSIHRLGGPYMKDWDLVMKQVLEKGAGNFVRDWFAGKLSADLVVEPLQAASEQLEVLREQLQRANGQRRLYVNVSHDWNVLLVRHFYLDREAGAWPDYLEALALWPDGEKLILQQGKKRRQMEKGLSVG